MKRSRVLPVLLALLPLCSLAASDPMGTTSQVNGFRHGVSLRDNGTEAFRANLPLPPGGRELEMQPVFSTPYDRYFGSVRSVIASMDPHSMTMGTACHLMKVGHSFAYVTRDPYPPDPPKLTEVQHSGDCKSKALWLYENLSDGDALFVIGKAEKYLHTCHAWVYWRNGGRWWILDCTDRADPIAADSVSPDRYIPYYSFGKRGTYRHPAAGMATASAGNVASNTSASIFIGGTKKGH